MGIEVRVVSGNDELRLFDDFLQRYLGTYDLPEGEKSLSLYESSAFIAEILLSAEYGKGGLWRIAVPGRGFETSEISKDQTQESRKLPALVFRGF